MKIDFSRILIALDGTAFQSAPGKPISLGDACSSALHGQYEDEKNLNGNEKFERGALATRIYNAKEDLDLKVDELALIKKLVGKFYGPNLVHPIWTLLEKS